MGVVERTPALEAETEFKSQHYPAPLRNLFLNNRMSTISAPHEVAVRTNEMNV